jgi:hypothetical protein
MLGVDHLLIIHQKNTKPLTLSSEPPKMKPRYERFFKEVLPGLP